MAQKRATAYSEAVRRLFYLIDDRVRARPELAGCDRH
jgi:hypothetical protein